MKKVLPEEFRNLLSCVTQIKVVANLKDIAFNTLAVVLNDVLNMPAFFNSYLLQEDPCASHWDELTQRLLGTTLSIWGDLLEPAVHEKIELIIRSSLAIAIEGLEKSARENITKYDLKSWLWTDALSDLPQSSPAPQNSSGGWWFQFFCNKHLRSFSIGVFMKTRCYLPTIQKLCTQWDNKLDALLTDLSNYQEGKEVNYAFKPFDKAQSRVEVNRILSQLCQESALR